MTFLELLAVLVVFHVDLTVKGSLDTVVPPPHLSGKAALLPRVPDIRSEAEFTVSPLPVLISSLEPQSNPPRARRKRKMSVSRKGEEWEERSCRLRALQLRVQDLGLGYQSDEIVLFKYCSGSCPQAQNNHNLILSLLLRKPGFPNLSQEKIVSDPCCRPTHFKDVTFLDLNNQWHTVEKLSASECSCIG